MPTSSTKPTSKVGRNDRCECNSGKKVKACCGMKKAEKSAVPKTSTAAHQELLHPSRDTMQDYTNSLRDKAVKLADKIFDEPEVVGDPEAGVSVVSETNVAGKTWKSYVVLKGAETTPLESQLHKHVSYLRGITSGACGGPGNSFGGERIGGLYISSREALSGG